MGIIARFVESGKAEQFSPELSWRSAESVLLIVPGRERVGGGEGEGRGEKHKIDSDFRGCFGGQELV